MAKKTKSAKQQKKYNTSKVNNAVQLKTKTNTDSISKKNTSKSKVLSRVTPTLRSVKPITWLWLIGLFSVFIIFTASAITGAEYSRGRELVLIPSNVEFGFFADDATQITTIAESKGLALISYDNLPADNLRIEVKDEEKYEILPDLKSELEALAAVNTVTIYNQEPISIVPAHTMNTFYLFGLLTLGAFIACIIYYRKEGLLFITKSWTLITIISISAGLSLVVSGIIISNAGLAKFTPLTESMMALIFSLILIAVVAVFSYKPLFTKIIKKAY